MIKTKWDSFSFNVLLPHHSNNLDKRIEKSVYDQNTRKAQYPRYTLECTSIHRLKDAKACLHLFIYATDAIEWINNEYSKRVIPHLNIFNEVKTI